MRKVGIFIVGISIFVSLLTFVTELLRVTGIVDSYAASVLGMGFLMFGVIFASIGGIIWGIGIFIAKSETSIKEKIFCAICILLFPLLVLITNIHLIL